MLGARGQVGQVGQVAAGQQEGQVGPRRVTTTFYPGAGAPLGWSHGGSDHQYQHGPIGGLEKVLEYRAVPQPMSVELRETSAGAGGPVEMVQFVDATQPVPYEYQCPVSVEEILESQESRLATKRMSNKKKSISF